MTFENRNGVLIVIDGLRTIASTPTHTIEMTGDGMRLTFNSTDLEFTTADISFDDLVNMLPK